jgi:hypothetical protein
MVIIEQHGHDLTLRRGEQIAVLPAASAAQRLAVALAQLGVTATRPQTTEPLATRRSMLMIANTPAEQAALAAEIAADPAPLGDSTLAARDAYAEGWEIDRAAACAALLVYAQDWDAQCAALNGAQ